MTSWNEPNACERAGWPTLVMGLLLGISAWGLTLLAALLALAGITAAIVPAMETEDGLMLLMIAVGILVLAGLLLPGAVLNLRDFFALPLPRFHLPQPSTAQAWPMLLAAWFFLLALGHVLTRSETLTLVLLPFVNAAALLLPAGIILLTALRGLPLPLPRRAWSIFGASALLGPALSIFFELLAFLVFGLLFFAYVHAIPALETPFRLLMDEVRSADGSPDFAARQVALLLLSPGGWLLLLGLFALAVPLIEEAFKVTLLGFYAGRMRSPAEGFVGGVLCGAAFAVAENIGFSSAGAQDWLMNVLTRSIAILAHVFNSGLVGWGLILAWQKRDYRRLGLAYLAAVLVHSLWNGLSVALSLHSLASLTAAEVSPLIETPLPAGIGWGVLAAGLALGLHLANRQVRREDGV